MPEVKVPESRDRTARGIASRVKDLFKKTAGRPSRLDDDETVVIVPRRAGAAVRPRPSLPDFDEEE